jgi:hypothetical protein
VAHVLETATPTDPTLAATGRAIALLVAVWAVLRVSSCADATTVVIDSSNLTFTVSEQHRWHWTETCPGNERTEGLVAYNQGSSPGDTVVFWSLNSSSTGVPPTSGDIILNPGSYEYVGVLPPNTGLVRTFAWSITLTQKS